MNEDFQQIYDEESDSCEETPHKEAIETEELSAAKNEESNQTTKKELSPPHTEHETKSKTEKDFLSKSKTNPLETNQSLIEPNEKSPKKFYLVSDPYVVVQKVEASSVSVALKLPCNGLYTQSAVIPFFILYLPFSFYFVDCSQTADEGS